VTNYPENLIPTDTTANEIRTNVCDHCKMIHRVDPDFDLYTIGDEIDPEVINYDRLCGLSLNVFLCKRTPLSSICNKDYVKYELLDLSKKMAFQNFTSGSEVPNSEDINFYFNTKLKVIGFKKSDLEKISDNYPFTKSGKDEKTYNFKIKIEYKPTIVNVFHFQVEIYGNHIDNNNKEGAFRKLKGKTSSKKYLDSIISKIRNRVIKDNFLFEVI